MKCHKCGTEVPYSDDKCPTCGHYMGPPNVRAVRKPEETKALQIRYEKALEIAEADGTSDQLNKFETVMAKTCAVINVDLYYLHHFFLKDEPLYSTYSFQVRGQTRKSASARDDQQRRGIDGTILGGYAEEIRYAALSVDGSGLKSYGEYTMKLKEVAIAERSTLLEDNSYHFVEKHKIIAGAKTPLGYRAIWGDRKKLTVAKLYKKITPQTSENEFARILLFSEGNRATDEFVEVHIYGAFDKNAVESVRGKFAASKKGAMAREVKEFISKTGANWVEE